MNAYTIEFMPITIEAESRDEALDEVMAKSISGWFPEIFIVQKREYNAPTKKMLYALYCTTGLNTKMCSLSFTQVSELLSMSKRNGGSKTKKEIADTYLEWERENRA